MVVGCGNLSVSDLLQLRRGQVVSWGQHRCLRVRSFGLGLEGTQPSVAAPAGAQGFPDLVRCFGFYVSDLLRVRTGQVWSWSQHRCLQSCLQVLRV